MAQVAQDRPPGPARGPLPRIVFVLGKGGVGRSTVAAGLGLASAARGERCAVLGWALADPLGPWFGAPAVGPVLTELAPRLWAANFSLDEALRAYFVDHLHLGPIYRRIVRAPPVARLLELAPGLAEMFFLGHLWWLVTLAEREAGLAFDRLIVDAPATGHATSLLDVPATIARMGAGGQLAVETRRVTALLADPARTGAVLVATPEPLVIDETLELAPRVARQLGQPARALVVNASTTELTAGDDAWLAALPAGPRAAARSVRADLRRRAALEAELRAQLPYPSMAIPELTGCAPRALLAVAARALEAAW